VLLGDLYNSRPYMNDHSRQQPHVPPSWRNFPVIFVLALVMLSTEVTVTRLLAYKFYYHYVFLVLSLAQLGLAAAGAWIYALDLKRFGPRTFVRGTLGVAFLSVTFVFAYVWLSPDANVSLGKIQGATALPYLVSLSLILVGLYFCAGMVFSAYFTQYKEQFHRLYAADLVGAATGCAAALGLMWLMGPINALLVTAVLTAVTAWIVPRDGQRVGALWHALAGFTIVASLAAVVQPRLVDAGRTASRPSLEYDWNHLARTDRTEESCYIIDGDAGTCLEELGRGMASADLEFSLVRPEPSVAIIGVGAGQQLAESLAHGASSVMGVDINPSIIAWSRGKDAEYNGGIYNRPDVTVQVDEGRHAIRSSQQRFDLVLMHAIDTYTASAMGAYSLSENHLYTVEAFGDYHDVLADGGVMAIRRWAFHPPRENLRLFISAFTALEERGVADPASHLMLVVPTPDPTQLDLQVWGLMMFARDPLSSEQIATAEIEVTSRNWSFLYRPDQAVESAFTEFTRSSDRESFYRDYPYFVRPCRDRKPFFFQLAKPQNLLNIGLGSQVTLYDTSSVSLLVSLLLLVSLTLLLLAVPLVVRRRKLMESRPTAARTVYFACLGVGFMTAEIAAIQTMTFFLGHPTYALVVVLLGILAFAGVGSLLVSRLPRDKSWWVCGAVALLAVLSAFGLFPIVQALIAQPFAVRVGLTLVYLAAMCVLMGMPMAAGIRLIGEGSRTQVAWAWVCNGGAGVVGSNVCMLVMIYLGTPAAFLLAAACYLAALVAMLRMLAEAR